MVKRKPAETLQQMEAVERRETVYRQEMVRELIGFDGVGFDGVLVDERPCNEINREREL